MSSSKNRVGTLVDRLQDVTEAVSSAANVAVNSVAQSTQFAHAVQPVVEAGGGRLTGDQLRVILERDDSAAMGDTVQRRREFIEEHGVEAWNKHVEAVDSVEAGPDGVKVNSN